MRTVQKTVHASIPRAVPTAEFQSMTVQETTMVFAGADMVAAMAQVTAAEVATTDLKLE